MSVMVGSVREGAQYAYWADEETVPVEDLLGRDRRWIQRAVGVAFTSNHHFPLGALAVTGGSLIAKETNRYRNTPRLVEWEHCSVHAEAALTRHAIGGSIVYVARTTATGVPAMARPCKACLSTLTDAGVRRVVWTVDEDYAGTMNLG